MNKNLTFFSLLLLIGLQPAYADIRQKLEKDSASYQVFLDLGKTSCMADLFKTTKTYRPTKESDIYQNHFNTLAALQSPLTESYRDTSMKKTFSAYQKQNIGLLIKKYREREEYFNINRSPFLICSKLFAANAATKKLYRDFLYTPGYLIKDPHPESAKRLEAKIGRWTDNP